MKKSIFIILLLTVPFFLFAQKPNYLAGIQLSPTLNMLKGNSVTNEYDAKLDFSGGFSFEYPVTSNFYLKTALGYERKGAKTTIVLLDEYSMIVGHQHVKFNFNYLVLPVLVTLYTNGKIKLYVNSGPYFGFLLNQNIYYSAVGEHPEFEADYTDYTRRIDWGLSVGFGIQLPIKNNILFETGLTGDFGLTNTSKSELLYSGSIRPNSFGLQFGIKYNSFKLK
ncbi:MAG TPA: porin family protein [Bacteroidales bacterium]|nr:porin family protein [Bacteroidales bacterium]